MAHLLINHYNILWWGRFVDIGLLIITMHSLLRAYHLYRMHIVLLHSDNCQFNPYARCMLKWEFIKKPSKEILEWKNVWSYYCEYSKFELNNLSQICINNVTDPGRLLRRRQTRKWRQTFRILLAPMLELLPINWFKCNPIFVKSHNSLSVLYTHIQAKYSI